MCIRDSNIGGTHIDFNAVTSAPLLGWPNFVTPTFDWHAVTLIAPVAIVLVAENLGHVKAVAAMTGRDLDPYIGRAFLADGFATMVANPSARNARPMYGSRSRPVIAATALTCPRFSATRTMATGAIRVTACQSNVGVTKFGQPKSGALVTALKSMCVPPMLLSLIHISEPTRPY